jgi:quinohemoprotein ethanol dehydrogenase
VALDADTGRYLWHYQINPRDSWDFDATQQMILADLNIRGRRRPVLMQAPKNGFFYVIDRGTGKLLSAEKYAKATWAERIDLRTGRPVEIKNLRYQSGAVAFWPSSAGAHNFQPMAFNPATGLVYIPTMKLAMRIRAAHDERDLQDFKNENRKFFPVQASDSELIKLDPDDGTAGLLAWDPVAQKKRWEVRYPNSFWNGGTLTSAGNLVFQGTGRGQFIAYDASSGARLWSFDTGLGVIAAPATFEIDGVQYISLLVGYGGSAGNGTALFDYGWRFNEQPRRLLTFALHAHEPLPPTNPPRFILHPVDVPTLAIDSELAAAGERVFNSSCFLCHGAHLEGTGSIAPDLRESGLAVNFDSFSAVVHQGALAGAGMPNYSDLTEADVKGLYMYIRKAARDAAAQPTVKPTPDASK